MRIRRRWPSWPPITHNGRRVPSEVKRLSTTDLSRLCSHAASSGWSARGRATWLQEHGRDIEVIYLTAFGWEEPGVLRCIVTPRQRDGTMGVFSLDVSRHDFDRLTTLSRSEAVELMHLLLTTRSHIPLQPDGREGAAG